MANVGREQSATKEFFLQLLHLMWMFTVSGCKTPPDALLDRRRYEAICKSQEAWRMKQLVQRLKEQKLAEIRTRGEHIQVILTHEGKAEGLRLFILSTQKELTSGEYCLVSFDLPEDIRWARGTFRKFLKAAGFERVHHSLWKSNKDVLAPMQELIRAMNATKWIKAFSAHE